ncbi:hypothetical protein VCHENC02_4023B, partial [Vibrio harveyi]
EKASAKTIPKAHICRSSGGIEPRYDADRV